MIHAAPCDAPTRPDPGAANRATSALRTLVLDGELAPGQRLSEELLASRLKLSRNTLREAFRALALEGLVEHHLNRGVFVRVMSAADIIDVFTVRQTIETAGVAMCASVDLAEVREAVERGEHAAGEFDWPSVVSSDIDFHAAIVALLGSPRLDRLMAQCLAELRLAFHRVGTSRGFYLPYLRRNRMMLDLMAAGAISEAAAALTDYLVDARDELLEVGDVRIGGAPRG